MRRVTEIIRDVFGAPDLYGTPDDIAFWCERGTAVHAATALWDRNMLDMTTVDERIMGRLRGWQMFRRQIGGVIIAIEHEVGWRRLYAGRLDRVIRKCNLWPFDDVVVDIKSGAPFPVCALQTMGYKLGWQEGHPSRRTIRRACVQLRDDGTYVVIEYTRNELDEACWRACVEPSPEGDEIIKAWKRRNGIHDEGKD